METSEDILSISKKIEQKINARVIDIVQTHRDRLMLEEYTYIIPAVWGAKKDAELDSIQLQIYTEVNRTVDEVMQDLSIETLTSPQSFALRYLINQNIISMVTYMMEMTKKHISETISAGTDPYNDLGPAGNA